MSKHSEGGLSAYGYTQNRELSWLRFNRRVLEEAGDERVPLIERLKFIAIYSSNMDEFFMVRVGSLFDISRVSPDEIDSKSGMTPAEQLNRIYSTVPGLLEIKRQLYARVNSKLKQLGLQDVGYAELNAEETGFVNRYFRDSILPVISPIIVTSHHPMPHLVNKSLYVAALLRDKKDRTPVGFIPMPAALPPYIALPGSGRYIRCENILLHWAPTLFGSYRVEDACVLCVTRNADLSFDGEKFEDSDADFRSRMLQLLKKRDNLSVVRLELSHAVAEAFLRALTRLVQVEKHQIYIDSAPLNMKYVYSLTDSFPAFSGEGLLFSPYKPRWPEDLLREQGMIEQIQRRDRLLFFPFDSMEPFLRLLNEAAENPEVISIKITIYRMASASKIARTLCRAAENGKEVIVMMELRARFDEANNISWSKSMEEAGCQLVYGIEDFKCHSKICLITLRGKAGLRYITQIGTGNYNEKTSTMYTDLSVLTASEAIGIDATAFFRNMLVNNLDGEYAELLVAPSGIKSTLLQLIDGEIEKGAEGYICIKANSVTEREVIDRLRDASVAGVDVELIIRGICCLLPGIPRQTENIHVTSIVGRYLEHARIYCFGRGEGAKLYISSADLMTRNLNRRVEIACPVHDPELKAQLCWILNTQLADNVKASLLLSDGSYARKTAPQQALQTNAQERFMAQSMHRPAEPAAPHRARKAPILERLRARLHRPAKG